MISMSSVLPARRLIRARSARTGRPPVEAGEIPGPVPDHRERLLGQRRDHELPRLRPAARVEGFSGR